MCQRLRGFFNPPIRYQSGVREPSRMPLSRTPSTSCQQLWPSLSGHDRPHCRGPMAHACHERCAEAPPPAQTLTAPTAASPQRLSRTVVEGLYSQLRRVVAPHMEGLLKSTCNGADTPAARLRPRSASMGAGHQGWRRRASEQRTKASPADSSGSRETLGDSQ